MNLFDLILWETFFIKIKQKKIIFDRNRLNFLFFMLNFIEEYFLKLNKKFFVGD